MKLVVTGLSGKAGRAVVADLPEHGHDVRRGGALPGQALAPCLLADLTDSGQALECGSRRI